MLQLPLIPSKSNTPVSQKRSRALCSIPNMPVMEKLSRVAGYFLVALSLQRGCEIGYSTTSPDAVDGWGPMLHLSRCLPRRYLEPSHLFRQALASQINWSRDPRKMSKHRQLSNQPHLGPQSRQNLSACGFSLPEVVSFCVSLPLPDSSDDPGLWHQPEMGHSAPSRRSR